MQILEKIEKERLVFILKRMRKVGYIVLFVIVLVMSLTIYTNASQKEKVFSEIKFLETKLVNLFNTMNSIDTRNYKVTTSEFSKETIETTEKSSSGGGQSEQGGSSGGGSGASRW